jgi:hypothetical protein
LAVVAVNRTMAVDNPAMTSAATTTREITRAGRRLAGRLCPRGLFGPGVIAAITLSVRWHVTS